VHTFTGCSPVVATIAIAFVAIRVVYELSYRTTVLVALTGYQIGFAAVGRYNEFDNLRTAGIRSADLRGYSYDRRDVTGRWLANAYAQLLGTSFVDQQKPYEVELCLAEVGADTGADQLYRITYDGSITDEPQFVVMGGTTEPISAKVSSCKSQRRMLRIISAISLLSLSCPLWQTSTLPESGIRV
jgi:proteasome alpha subunit